MRMQGILPTVPLIPAKKFRWTDEVVDLVELLYALDTCDCINDGEIGVEDLADAFSEIFGIEIKNCYNVYMKMKKIRSARSKEKTEKRVSVNFTPTEYAHFLTMKEESGVP
ncbi:hypothetical protein CLI75_11220, partial [Porphyromonas gingivalis]|uniref:RteC domain-containing protein n=1 Tax=Porphyromonas gingivalis TaxID=837 RepID=UPI000BE72842